MSETKTCCYHDSDVECGCECHKQIDFNHSTIRITLDGKEVTTVTLDKMLNNLKAGIRSFNPVEALTIAMFTGLTYEQVISLPYDHLDSLVRTFYQYNY